jgi:hypothetical protein
MAASNSVKTDTSHNAVNTDATTTDTANTSSHLVHAVIANIPSRYHSADLRHYFSQFIESGGFDCFHHRHRPEIVRPASKLVLPVGGANDGGTRGIDGMKEGTVHCFDKPSVSPLVVGANDGETRKVEGKKTEGKGTTCCVVRLTKDRLGELVRMYGGKRWVDRKGETISAKCRITKVKVVDGTQDRLPLTRFPTRAELRLIPADRETFTSSHLATLPELNPPPLMPHGNVGTPTKLFLRLIQQCKLPPSIIAKLDLAFPRTYSNRRYGTVPLDYGTDCEIIDYEPNEQDSFCDAESAREMSVETQATLNDSESKDSLGCNTNASGIFGSTGATVLTRDVNDVSYKSKTVADDGKGISLGTYDMESDSVLLEDTGGNADITSCDKMEKIGASLESDSATFISSESSFINIRGNETNNKGSNSTNNSTNLKESKSSSQSRGQEKTTNETGVPTYLKQSKASKHKVNHRVGNATNKSTKERKEQNDRFRRNNDASSSDSDDCEEWDRYTALHDDPTNQERNAERMFEDEMEVVWEKGGSGLVWYTDAQYWDQMDGDEEEKDTDDWDLDFSAYYHPEGGDKDARDFVRMTRDVRRRKGEEWGDDDMHAARIGQFECHTKGIGRKLMTRQGWTDGQGLGSRVQGMAAALDGEGQKPWDKKGFGYRGEKLVHAVSATASSFQSTKRPRRIDPDLPIISTVYDDARDTDPAERLLRRQEPYHLKHRAGAVRFLKSDEVLRPS